MYLFIWERQRDRKSMRVGGGTEGEEQTLHWEWGSTPETWVHDLSRNQESQGSWAPQVPMEWVILNTVLNYRTEAIIAQVWTEPLGAANAFLCSPGLGQTGRVNKCCSWHTYGDTIAWSPNCRGFIMQTCHFCKVKYMWLTPKGREESNHKFNSVEVVCCHSSQWRLSLGSA